MATTIIGAIIIGNMNVMVTATGTPTIIVTSGMSHIITTDIAVTRWWSGTTNAHGTSTIATMMSIMTSTKAFISHGQAGTGPQAPAFPLYFAASTGTMPFAWK